MFRNTLNSLLVDDVTFILSIVVVAIVAIAIGFFVGYFIFKTIRAKKIGETKEVVAKMIEDAQSESKQIKKEAILESKEQDLKLRNEFERETKEKRAEMQKLESRLIKRMTSLTKKKLILLSATKNLKSTSAILMGLRKI